MRNNMKLFADSKNLEEVETDVGEPVGQLLTPLTYRQNFRPENDFGIDNGCFVNFNKKKFYTLLERELPNAKNCKFVALPDVVGSARRTLELFEHYRHEYPITQFKKALVIQNGQENFPIEWDLIDAIFIGGDDRYKHSFAVKTIIQCAKRLEKWVHVGRINGVPRWNYFAHLGVDSCDGTGFSMYSENRWRLFRNKTQPKLFETA